MMTVRPFPVFTFAGLLFVYAAGPLTAQTPDLPPQSTLRELNLAPFSETPAGLRARALLDASAQHEQQQAWREIRRHGLDLDAMDPRRPDWEGWQDVAARARKLYAEKFDGEAEPPGPYADTLAARAMEDFVEALDDRQAWELVQKRGHDLQQIDFDELQRMRSQSPEEYDDLQALLRDLVARFPNTPQGFRAGYLLDAVAAQRRLQGGFWRGWAAPGEQPPAGVDEAFQQALEASARDWLEKARRRIPEQRIDALRQVAVGFPDTRAGKAARRDLADLKADAERRRSRDAARDRRGEERSRFLRRYWSYRYGE